MAQSSSLMTEKIKRTVDALLRVVPGQTARRFNKVLAQCGFDLVQELPVTFGKNEKGG
jgi:hypothetical protein